MADAILQLPHVAEYAVAERGSWAPRLLSVSVPGVKKQACRY